METNDLQVDGKGTSVFLICSVRGATPEALAEQEEYVHELERRGYVVHYPPRDTKQDASSLQITRQNFCAMEWAKEVHVWYNPDSQGTHFDLGMAFALGKTLTVAKSVPYGTGKSYPRLLREWANVCRDRDVDA